MKDPETIFNKSNNELERPLIRQKIRKCYQNNERWSRSKNKLHHCNVENIAT